MAKFLDEAGLSTLVTQIDTKYAKRNSEEAFHAVSVSATSGIIADQITAIQKFVGTKIATPSSNSHLNIPQSNSEDTIATQTWVTGQIQGVTQFGYQIVQALPTASANTMNEIYLVLNTGSGEASESNNYYEEYITLDKGSGESPRYVWEKLGDLKVDLSNYIQNGDNAELVALTVGDGTGYETRLDDHGAITTDGGITTPTIKKAGSTYSIAVPTVTSSGQELALKSQVDAKANKNGDTNENFAVDALTADSISCADVLTVRCIEVPPVTTGRTNIYIEDGTIDADIANVGAVTISGALTVKNGDTNNHVYTDTYTNAGGNTVHRLHLVDTELKIERGGITCAGSISSGNIVTADTGVETPYVKHPTNSGAQPIRVPVGANSNTCYTTCLITGDNDGTAAQLKGIPNQTIVDIFNGTYSGTPENWQ